MKVTTTRSEEVFPDGVIAAIARLLNPLIAHRRSGIIGLSKLSQLLPQAEKIKTIQNLPAACLAGPFGIILFDQLDELVACWESNRAEAIHVLVSSVSLSGCEPDSAFRSHVLVRSITGSLVVDAAYAAPKAVRVCTGPALDMPEINLALWSDQPLPDLAVGLYMHGEGGAMVSTVGKVETPLRSLASTGHRAPAVLLGKRLQAVEERFLTLRADNLRLRSSLSENAGAIPQEAAFDPPRARHPWPLAEFHGAEPPSFGLYDRRPDDAVLFEAAAGEAFFASFGLNEATPRFAAAVAALNALEPGFELNAELPDFSIIIPVYGQLAYTLNAVDSLLRHVSRCSAEVIIIDDCSPDGVTRRFAPTITRMRYHRLPANGGFIKSCNAGAALARGRYVIMLNSDIRVVAGWLDNLFDSFTLFPRAGLVGSKMLYADGSLQEAGSIIWRDGSAWNYGRNDDPNRPQYCYAREVDYVSGCSIALSIRLWQQLGGFDEYFSPAYAEDADLCQRVMQAGYEVWFQPLSRVLHYEGKTSGTDTNAGVKSYQVTNLKKLFVRWRDLLSTHRRLGDNPFMERERKVRKRLLIVDSVTPTPDQDAGSLQTVLALRCARLNGYKAHFVPEDNWLFVVDYTSQLQKSGVDCSYAPYHVGFENYIRHYGWLFDVIITYRVSIMDRCLALLRAHAPQAAIIFHVADLHHLRMHRQAMLDGSVAGDVAAAAMREKEFSIIQRVDCTITHSTVEAQIIADAVPAAPVVTWPLMVDFAGSEVDFAQRRDICFLGGYRHPPNAEAVVFFVRDVFPLLRKAEPGIRFIIAGANPTKEIEELACDDIDVAGFIPDLRQLFDPCRVFICPLLVGAGVKGKVVSAMAYGIPVVTTQVGAEGGGLTDGVDVLIADQPSDFAAAITRLYRDEHLWRRLSHAGQALIRRDFSVEIGQSKLNESIDKAYSRKLGLPYASC